MCNVWSGWRTRVVSALRWIWIQCDYARLRVRGEGSFVCQFACLLRLRDLWYLWYLRDPWYLRMFACLQWSHGSRVCVLVSLVSLHMHVCNEMIGRVFACLQ